MKIPLSSVLFVDKQFCFFTLGKCKLVFDGKVPYRGNH